MSLIALLGPWLTEADAGTTTHRAPVAPGGSSVSVDLRCPSRADSPNVGLHLVSEIDPAADPGEYIQLGTGTDLSSLTVNGRNRSAWRSLTGLRVTGSSVAECLMQSLTDQSDIDGNEGPRPLMPGRGNRLAMAMGLGSNPWRHAGDKLRPDHPHWHRVRDRWQRESAEHLRLEDAGQLAVGTAQKALGARLLKLGLRLTDDWSDLVAAADRERMREPRKPETTYSNDFSSARSGWTDSPASTWTTSTTNPTNGLRKSSGNGWKFTHPPVALSSTDHYAQSLICYSTDIGVVARMNLNALTGYSGRVQSTRKTVHRRDGSSATSIINVSGSFSFPITTGVLCEGGDISGADALWAYYGTTVDTTYSGELYFGFWSSTVSGSAAQFDDLFATDELLSLLPILAYYYRQLQG